MSIIGYYELSDKNEPIDFWAASPPTVKEIEEVLTKIIQKITKYLERQKIIIKDDNDGGFQIPIPDEDTLEVTLFFKPFGSRVFPS